MPQFLLAEKGWYPEISLENVNLKSTTTEYTWISYEMSQTFIMRSYQESTTIFKFILKAYHYQVKANARYFHMRQKSDI